MTNRITRDLSSLSGKLGPRPPSPAVAVTAPQPAPRAEDHPAPTPPPPATTTTPSDPPSSAPTPRANASAPRTAPPKAKTFTPRIPASLFARVNDARSHTGETHEMWFLAAFDRVYDQLADHYQTPHTSSTSRVPQRRRRARRIPGEPLTQYPLRLTADEAAALQHRADELEPTSMAEFVTTIVELALPQH